MRWLDDKIFKTTAVSHVTAVFYLTTSDGPLTPSCIDSGVLSRFPWQYTLGVVLLCTWYSHTEQDTVVDDRNEAQDTFGLLQLLRFQAQLHVAWRRHIGPADHDLGPSLGGKRRPKREMRVQVTKRFKLRQIFMWRFCWRLHLLCTNPAAGKLKELSKNNLNNNKYRYIVRLHVKFLKKKENHFFVFTKTVCQNCTSLWPQVCRGDA